MTRSLSRLFFAVLLATGMALSFIGSAHAATDYSDSRLMDDAIFDNVGSMNESQIQSFLSSKTGCLASYQTLDANYNSTSGWTYSGSVSAAHLIYKAAQQWGLNPQVIIATLQKEESLVSGTACDSWRYNSAMGYACPDSGGCDAHYAGFTKQVLWGAWQLKFNKERAYGNTAWDGDGSITYIGLMTQGDRSRVAGGTSNYYDGNATIDGQTIYMTNGATASFYTYTPHLGQSLPGIFESWFGPTIVPNYAWQYVSQSSSADLTALPVGQEATLVVSAKNTGSTTWYQGGTNPVHLATSHPNDRTSSFRTSSWLDGSRAAALDQTSVAPGATGTFTFKIQAPNQPGTYNEYFNIVAEGVTWFNDPALYYGINVVSPQLSATTSYSALPIPVQTDSTATTTVSAVNTGNTTWYKGDAFPVSLGTCSPNDRTSQFHDASWPSQTRAASLNQTAVAPGATGTFTLKLDTPDTPGSYNESFCLVADSLSWFGPTITVPITVQGTYQADSLGNANVAIVSGQTASVTLSFRNSGTATWSNTGATPVKLGTAAPRDRTSQFYDPTWQGPTRPAFLNEASVAPGGTGTFTFTVDSQPGQTGTFNESFSPVAEGQEWFGTPAVAVLNVRPATYSWSVAGQQSYTDSQKTTGLDPTKLSPGQTAWFVVTARNTGNVTWSKTGANPVKLGTDFNRDRASPFATSAWYGSARPAMLDENSVAPGATGTFEFPINVPNMGGDTKEYFNLVAEGITWFNDPGLYYQIHVSNGYSWSLKSQYVYTDSTKTTPFDLSTIARGQTVWVGFTAQNTGTATWFNSGSYPVDVGTSRPIDRTSQFQATGWADPHRPAHLLQTSIAPGQIGTFEFPYTAGASAGTYREYFNLVAESITWFNDPLMNFYTVVH